MRLQPVDSLSLTRTSLVEYYLFGIRLAHGIACILPGLAIMMLIKHDGPETQQGYMTMLLFFGFVGVLVFQAMGVYSEALFSNDLRMGALAVAWTAAFGLLLFMQQAMGLFGYLSPEESLIWYLTSLALFGIIRLLLLMLFKRQMRKGVFLQHAVILGATENGLRLAEYLLEHQDIRSGVTGFIDDRIGRMPKTVANLPLLGNTSDLERLIREEKVTQVLVALPWTAENRMDYIIRELRRLPVNVLLVPDMIAFRHTHNRITEVARLPMFNASDLPLSGWSPFIKRAEDIVLSSLALLVLSPVMLLVALAIKLDSPGPVFFRQKRYGYNNRLIEVFKFRSMHQHQADATAERQTTRGDARITRVGRFIRKTSLDELPQLFNVAAGSMSMVGPRPHATATKAAGILFEQAVKEYTSRHRVKPGITGLAQINGYRGETDTVEKIEKRVEFDLEYIENWSVWFDLYILMRTVPAVLFTREAY
ncbi:capsular biosynthesis protein [Pseudomonas amygdali pv. tabaci str. ATCC 11528]|uniref:Capsular polysaccharide biosynthesis protein n=2 Tax=Pseudomonas amygdali pv. lachrymans TaxID=53707 RepID=A0AB37RFG7_PSEAV|nr:MULTISPECIES: undecaprenyl-phosphate glucose phosphotransferase [Pseudomonas syringae group]ARA80611.1 undecaprenyl-phosphate glucose phosphotransferase [Pseudomonas amygdali pv. lachrymans]AXH56036.1 undecaprenyl-phosphate glucose phosphotransferase [Pseudomonas amygdali pv. lachrymans str. M301315]KEZ67234.1 capsular biosynthesis protein [Pseudomonas amygdali pv. tabaci str. ATCC 11528]KKY52269.1 capsular biosynthesis protein [Pseudomonas amygdali pv. tabaci str. ATCC 11528]KKY59297.1 cap